LDTEGKNSNEQPREQSDVIRRQVSEEENKMNKDPLDRTPYAVSPPRYSVSHQMVTTAFELPNFRITQNLGIVRGIVVRSRNVFATIGAGLQTLVGGNITVWTRLCEQTRADAFDIMIQHATEIGANAIVGARYDATEVSTGVTEVLAYGTAVIVEPSNPDSTYRS
jgi:uncharacterized protein YbjQ (UPF0145 family)